MKNFVSNVQALAIKNEYYIHFQLQNSFAEFEQVKFF